MKKLGGSCGNIAEVYAWYVDTCLLRHHEHVSWRNKHVST